MPAAEQKNILRVEIPADLMDQIRENRHFLAEIPDLPFHVISAEEAIALLA